MLTLYVLAFLAGAPAGRSPAALPILVDQVHRCDCKAPRAGERARKWAELHPGYVVVGTRCHAAAAEIELAS